MPWPYQTRDVTIANAASLSDAAPLGGALLAGIVMPGSWTAASLTFQVSHDGTTYRNVYDDTGTEYTVTVSTDRFIRIDPSYFSGAQLVKVRSGTAGASVNQGGARVITLCCRDIA